jgi:hypothetical protein
MEVIVQPSPDTIHTFVDPDLAKLSLGIASGLSGLLFLTFSCSGWSIAKTSRQRFSPESRSEWNRKVRFDEIFEGAVVGILPGIYLDSDSQLIRSSFSVLFYLSIHCLRSHCPGTVCPAC